MSYPFPYALGICAATVAFLAACTWLYMIAIEEAAAALNRREDRAAARKGEAARRAEAEAARRAEAAAHRARLAAEAEIERRKQTLHLAREAAAEAAEAARTAEAEGLSWRLGTGRALANALEIEREAAEALQAAEARAAR